MIYASVPVLQLPDQLDGLHEKWNVGESLLLVDNTPDGAWRAVAEEREWCYFTLGKNAGVPASWNIARAWFLQRAPHNHDLLLLASSSVQWGQAGLRGAMEQMRDAAGWQGCQTIDLGFHAIAWTRRVFELIGTFDENYWVGYDGDCDWAYRCILAGVLSDADPMPKIGMDAVCEDGRAITRMGLISHTAQTREYYCARWGGPPSEELFATPFNLGLPTWWWSPIHRPNMEGINLGESRYR